MFYRLKSSVAAEFAQCQALNRFYTATSLLFSHTQMFTPTRSRDTRRCYPMALVERRKGTMFEA